MNGTYLRGNALWFITEQGYCLALGAGRDHADFQACETAAGFLAGDDTEATERFRERTSVGPDRDADYDTADYEGKKDDLTAALSEMLTRANDPATPEPARIALKKAAAVIAAFYDVNEAIA
jgi:hypothetical protein